jgi:hypothetical protein
MCPRFHPPYERYRVSRRINIILPEDGPTGSKHVADFYE